MGFFSHLVHSVKHVTHKATHSVGHVVHEASHVVSGVAHKAEHIASDPLGAVTGGMSNKIMMIGGALVVFMVLR